MDKVRRVEVTFKLTVTLKHRNHDVVVDDTTRAYGDECSSLWLHLAEEC